MGLTLDEMETDEDEHGTSDKLIKCPSLKVIYYSVECLENDVNSGFSQVSRILRFKRALWRQNEDDRYDHA